MTESQQPPLMGFHWNEAEGDDTLNRGLLTIIAHDVEGYPHVIGTGFIVSRDDRKAVCVTAAHVFSEVRRLQSPPPRHSPSALPEFLPSPKSVDLDRRSLRAVSVEGGCVEAAVIDGLAFDEDRDIAFCSIALQDATGEAFFPHEFILDGTPPAVGDLVFVLSYGNQGVLDYKQHGDQIFCFSVKRRPVLRVGRVLAHYPGGHRLCRGPCIETSIPVYSGMSGGPAGYYGTEGAMKVFGLVCSDPDLDSEEKQNRSIEGRSIFALLPCQVSVGEDGKRVAKLTLQPHDVAGIFQPPKAKSK